MQFLVTHSGPFHADEVFATAVLSRLYPAAELVRTRDAADIAAMAPVAVTYDVGGRYDPDANIYDHHHANAPVRPCGTPYSSFGLVWKHFGHRFLSACGHADRAEAIWERIDRGIVLPVDMADNGRLTEIDIGVSALLNFSTRVLRRNPPVGQRSSAIYHERFLSCVRDAEALLGSEAEFIDAEMAADRVVADAVLAGAETVLELPEVMPYRQVLEDMDATGILFVIFPRAETGDWGIDTVRTEVGGWDPRCPLPAEWGGLENERLEEVCGIPGAKFSHPRQFFAAAGSRAAALAMIEAAMSRQAEPVSG